MTTNPTALEALRILLIEDSAIDADLIQRELKRHGLAFTARRVETKTALRNALADFDPHVVLSDLSMPGFIGTEAMTITHEALPAAPFIYVSGTVGEERAVELLKAGATDYVLKQNLARLAPVVERALREVAAERERRHAEEQLRKLSRAVEQSPTSLIITDASGLIEYVNPKFTEITGYSTAEVRGKNVRLLKSGETPAATYRDLWTTLAAGREWRGEFCNRRKNGELFWDFASISAVRNESGQITHFLSVQEEITQRKRFERLLEEKNLELQKASRAKDNFLASMSHELRTPLNAIIGFTGTLLMKLAGPLTTKQERQLKSVQASGRHLLSLINDILDLAKIGAGKVELHVETVDCQSVLAEVTTAVRPLAESKGLALRTFTPPGRIAVQTDHRALQQILLNLVSNAIKFTERGSIAITLAERDDHGQRCVEFRVADTGPGILPEDQADLFRAFVQGRTGATQRLEGSGLGLHLSQKLAGLLGGCIVLESEVGKGCTFTLALKRKPQSAELDALPAPAAPADLALA